MCVHCTEIKKVSIDQQKAQSEPKSCPRNHSEQIPRRWPLSLCNLNIICIYIGENVAEININFKKSKQFHHHFYTNTRSRPPFYLNVTCKSRVSSTTRHLATRKNQRTNGPVNAHLISWPRKAQNIQNLENMVKK